MTIQEVHQGIKLVCDISAEVATFYENKEALVSKLNSVSKEELDKVNEYYTGRSGVIVDLRKEVLDYLIQGKELDVETLDGFVSKHKKDKERQYRSYKNYYSIFFPIITFYGHNPAREFIESFIHEIIEKSGVSEKVKSIYMDFQGARQQGSDRLWLAIYNRGQETQSTGLQMFVDFYHGKVKYGIYKHKDQQYLKGPIESGSEDFDFKEMIEFFSDNRDLILNDSPQTSKLLSIPLKEHKLFKISHGHFKAKTSKEIIESFKKNHWIVVHEHTGKNQADIFKNELEEGDYVYITIGGNELIAIAQVKEGSWSYVPEDITNQDGWIYREVEYIRSAINSNPSSLRNKQELIYPSGNSTITQIKPFKLDEVNDALFRPYFGIEFIAGSNQTQTTDLPNTGPRNIILYGPPGTGKTYTTIDKAIEIATGLEVEKETRKDTFKSLRESGQVEFITFHQNYSYEDFIAGIRPDITNDQLRFIPYKGIFYQLAKRASDNYFNSSKSAKKGRSFSEVFTEIMEPINLKGESIKIEMASGIHYSITDLSEYSIAFTKPNGKSEHTLSIKTLEDIVNGTRQFTTGLGPYYNPLADLIRKKRKEGNEVQVQEIKKNFVLIIDEINRANISRVFGELITLLEEDKRIDADNELLITLPNGEKGFGIPPNLYLIGTMNTADKSIAHLDVALRRRFQFIGFYPDYDVLEHTDSELLKHINKRIFDHKKSADFLIGHGYFMTDTDTADILKNKVIPLLMEYFNSKSDLVEEIFRDSGWNVSYDYERFKWSVQSISE
ncbi:McrB family protein [Marinoscillum pacificum]|uniref:McrB family protein n=1 Tax=Marinoscillum pacificum TaxID=392723 RepID=UPI0021580113|nr:AAA family ATPase [Marinoscillum pacificum]